MNAGVAAPAVVLPLQCSPDWSRTRQCCAPRWRLRRQLSIKVAASSSGAPGEGFSGRDFLAEFDELFKSKPLDKEPAKNAGGLSGLFSRDAGSFRSLDDKPKSDKGKKKERVTKKFFATSPGKIEVKEVVDAFKLDEADVGSSPVQIALLSQRIKYVAAHLTEHPKDFASRRGLLQMVGSRKRHLLYLRRTDLPVYKTTIAKLGLKDNVVKTVVRRGRSS